MISENQELIKANERVASLEQRIEFRKHGGSGKYITELTQAKKERDKILFSITNDSTETEELIRYALEVQKKFEATKKASNELSKKLDSLSLFMDYIENGIPKWSDSHESTPEPNYEQISIRMKKERNLEGKLEIAQKAFDSALYKSQNSPKTYSGKYAGELQQTRNKLNLILKDVERFPSLIEFYQLRAKRDWLITITKELEEESEFTQIEIAKAELVIGV